MNDAGDYKSAIEEILYGDASKMKSMTDERDELLEAALAGVETQCRNDAWNATADNGNYAGAYDLIDETISYYEGLKSDYSGVAYYISEMEGFREDIKNNHLSYFATEAEKLANKGDLDALIDFCNTQIQYFGDDQNAKEIVEKNRANCVVHETMNLQSSGDLKGTVNYVYDHIAEGDYNLYMIELYENAANSLGVVTYAGNVNQLPQTGASGYVFDWTDQYTLSESDLYSLDLDELRIALYEIYARHGRTFISTIQQYFDGKSWYTNRNLPNIQFDASTELNDIERANAALIIDYMKRNGYMCKLN